MKKYSVVFDNQCGVCSIGVKTFQAVGLMEEDQGVELDSFQQNQIACNVDPARACDEMAVINNETLEVRYGYDGYVDLLSVNYPAISKLMAKSWMKRLFNPFYIFFASNRRVIAPIKPSETTCQPTLKKDYRLTFLLFMGIYAAVITFIKGELLQETEMFGFLNGWKLISITGLGWLLTGLTYQKADKWEYWGHLAMMAGSAVFLQTLGLVGFYLYPSIWWVIGSMLLSDPLMLIIHYRRSKFMGISQKQTLIWWVTLHVTASLLIALYAL